VRIVGAGRQAVESASLRSPAERLWTAPDGHAEQDAVVSVEVGPKTRAGVVAPLMQLVSRTMRARDRTHPADRFDPQAK
jgi:hypothetical protein